MHYALLTLRRLAVLLFGSLSLLPLAAQPAVQLAFMPGQLAAQWQQPAHLASLTPQSLTLGGGAAYHLGSRHLSLSRIVGTSGYLDAARKEAILAELGQNNRFRLDARGGGLLAWRGASQPWSLSYRRVSLTHLAFAEPHTLGLVLLGNAPYAGTPLSDAAVAAQLHTYDEIGLGTAWHGPNWQAGLRLKALIGQQGQHLDLAYQLFTEAEGRYLDLGLAYDYFQATGRGAGLGLDLGATFSPAAAWEVQVAVLDLGATRLPGDRYQLDESLRYEGVEVTDILNTDWQNLDEFFAVDSLQDRLVPAAQMGRRWLALPGQVQAGVRYHLSQRDKLLGQVAWGVQAHSAPRPLPQLSLGYQRQVWSPLTLGVHAYGGGIDNWGWGAMLAGEFVLGGQVRTAFFAEYQMGGSLGFIQGDQLRSLHLQGGLSFSLLRAAADQAGK